MLPSLQGIALWKALAKSVIYIHFLDGRPEFQTLPWIDVELNEDVLENIDLVIH